MRVEWVGLKPKETPRGWSTDIFWSSIIVELLLLFTDWHTKCVPFVVLFLSKTELVRQIYQMDTKAKSTSQNQKGMLHEVVVRN